MQLQTISKSEFKPKALEYLRLVEKGKKSLIITHNKRPIARVVPYEQKSDGLILKELKGSLIYYKDPTKPAGLSDWEALK